MGGVAARGGANVTRSRGRLSGTSTLARKLAGRNMHTEFESDCGGRKLSVEGTGMQLFLPIVFAAVYPHVTSCSKPSHLSSN